MIGRAVILAFDKVTGKCRTTRARAMASEKGASMKPTDTDLHRLWRRYWRDSAARYAAWEAGCDAAWQAWEANPIGRPPNDPPAPYDPFPDILRGLTCGARTRAGTPCKRIDLYRSGRCKYHGGMSTGPRSAEGKAVACQSASKRGSDSNSVQSRSCWRHNSSFE